MRSPSCAPPKVSEATRAGRGRHGVGVEHAERALDREHQLSRARLDSARPFERADHAVPARHLLAGLHLGQEKPGETIAADYGVEVGFGETGVEPVHPDPDPVAGDLGRVGAHAGARIRLLRKRHGIFEIEDERRPTAARSPSPGIFRDWPERRESCAQAAWWDPLGDVIAGLPPRVVTRLAGPILRARGTPKLRGTPSIFARRWMRGSSPRMKNRVLIRRYPRHARRHQVYGWPWMNSRARAALLRSARPASGECRSIAGPS